MTEHRSHKPGAQMLTGHVLASHLSATDISELAADYIRRALSPSLQPPMMMEPSSPSRAEREAAACIILSGQTDWSQISDATLLSPLNVTVYYPLMLPSFDLLRSLVFGTYRRQNIPFDRELGLDLKQHAKDLDIFRAAIEPHIFFPSLSDIGQDISYWPDGTVCPDLLDRLRRGQAIIMAVLRARMLGEYLRRRASDPFRQQAANGDVKWPLATSALMHGLVVPAKNLSKLMAVKINADATDAEALGTAIASGRLHYDKHLYLMAAQIRGMISQPLLDHAPKKAAQMIAGRLRDDVAPLVGLTLEKLKAAFGTRTLVEQEFGVTAAAATMVIAIQLSQFTAGQASQAKALPKELHKGLRTKARKIAAVLIAITGTDRRIPNAKLSQDNKAGTKTLNAALKALKNPTAAKRLQALVL
ncbi:MAG: hypothetical protein KGJ57_18585 [Sphingomonadales bacterium]|nr:hypothetical protein [Sphingomonadales bacterium]MDE2171405.1 hypothetical protein [Sphingomonadales bacterium]